MISILPKKMTSVLLLDRVSCWNTCNVVVGEQKKRTSQTTQRQSNESLGHSDGMKAMRSPQRRAHCRATKFLVMCDEGNAEPAAAHAPHNHEIHCSVSTP